jgi:hypothetical protein
LTGGEERRERAFILRAVSGNAGGDRNHQAEQQQIGYKAAGRAVAEMARRAKGASRSM